MGLNLPFILGALQRVRSQGGAQRHRDPLETGNTIRKNYNNVTTTNKCRNGIHRLDTDGKVR